MKRLIAKREYRAILATAAVAGLFAVKNARADEIMVNYYDQVPTIGTSATADGAPGAASPGYWNNLNIYGSGGVTNQTLTLASLTNSSGSATTAKLVDFSPFGGGNSTPSATTTAGSWTTTDTQLYGGEAGTDNAYNPLTISLSGIPYSSYSVYIYMSCLTNGTDSISDQSGKAYYFTGNTQVGAGGTGPYSEFAFNQAVGTSATSPSTDADYAVFYETTASSSFTLGYSTSSTNDGAWIYGIQIVSAPEPASLSLVALSAMALLSRRPRRSPRRQAFGSMGYTQ